MTSWVSVHAFHGGSLDDLLVEAVQPSLAGLNARGATRRWFFVRYWNGGRHLRLRVHARPGRADEVAGTLAEDLGEFLHAHPSGSEPDYARQAATMRAAFAEAARDWGLLEPEAIEPAQPPDSIQFRPYRFDAERFGGAAARRLAEGHFCRSSELATVIVSRSRRCMDARTSVAFELLAVMREALQLPAASAAALFAAAAEMSRYVGSDPAAFVGYEAQRDDILALVRHPGRHTSEVSLPAVACQVWAEELRTCHRVLRRLSAAGRLTCHPHQVLLSCAHMLNNRLGIGFAEECHLYRLFAQALEESLATRGAA